MSPSKIPYPNYGQGISLFSACCPSPPLAQQILLKLLLSACAWCRTLSASFTRVTTDDYAWIGCCDRR